MQQQIEESQLLFFVEAEQVEQANKQGYFILVEWLIW
jgi:hypothetical protein